MRRIAAVFISSIVIALGLGASVRAEVVAQARDINTQLEPGLATNPHGLAALGELVLFSAKDGGSGFELWRNDGTIPGTPLVKDIVPGPAPSNPPLPPNSAG